MNSERKMAKSIVFDTGPIISLATNSLLWLLKPLKDKFRGDFYITAGVKWELVDRPLEIKKFKFEALMVLSNIKDSTIEVIDEEKVRQQTEKLLDIANHIYKAKGNWINIVHSGEMQALAAAIMMNSSALVVDERTTRVLVEEPERLKDVLEHKLHINLEVNKQNLNDFSRMVKNIKVIRSTELVMIAYEMGLLDKFLPDIQNPKKMLLEGVLWGVKLHGCSISQREIDTLVKIEAKT